MGIHQAWPQDGIYHRIFFSNKLANLFSKLEKEGWYCGWGEGPNNEMAWRNIESKSKTRNNIDLDKVFFNHDEDINVEDKYSKMSDDERWDLLMAGQEYKLEAHKIGTEYFSKFSYSFTDIGVNNLKSILPIIEECGIQYTWNFDGRCRILLDWGDDNSVKDLNIHNIQNPIDLL